MGMARSEKLSFKFLEFLREIPECKFDQGIASYNPDTCCVGAHIAKHLINEDSHRDGYNEVMKRTGLNRAEIVVIFRSIGVRNPFSAMEWPRNVRDVVNDLMKIEDRPSLSKVDLSDAELTHIDLSGRNLTGSNLENAVLSAGIFHKTNFSNVNLKKAILYRAILLKANLSGVNLCGADLEESVIDRKYRYFIENSGALNIESVLYE